MWPAYSMYLLYISTCYVWVFIVCFLATKKKKHTLQTPTCSLLCWFLSLPLYTYTDTCEQHLTSTHIVSYERDFKGSFFYSWIRICYFYITWHFILLSPLEGKVYIETRSIFRKAGSSYWENPPVTGAFVKDCAHTSSLLRILPLPLSLDVVMRAWRTWLPAGSEASVSRSAGVRVRRLLRRSERSLNLASAWTSREPW